MRNCGIYGCKIWTSKQGPERRLKAAEMKFMRHTAEYILPDHRRYYDILEEFNVDPVENKLTQYK
jgi:hypothetical protein